MENKTGSKVRFWSKPEQFLLLTGLTDEEISKLINRSTSTISVKKSAIRRMMKLTAEKIGIPSEERKKEIIAAWNNYQETGITIPEMDNPKKYLSNILNADKEELRVKLNERGKKLKEKIQSYKKIQPQIVKRENVPHKFLINGMEVSIDKGIKNVHIGLDSIKVDF